MQQDMAKEGILTTALSSLPKWLNCCYQSFFHWQIISILAVIEAHSQLCPGWKRTCDQMHILDRGTQTTLQVQQCHSQSPGLGWRAWPDPMLACMQPHCFPTTTTVQPSVLSHFPAQNVPSGRNTSMNNRNAFPFLCKCNQAFEGRAKTRPQCSNLILLYHIIHRKAEREMNSLEEVL